MGSWGFVRQFMVGVFVVLSCVACSAQDHSVLVRGHDQSQPQSEIVVSPQVHSFYSVTVARRWVPLRVIVPYRRYTLRPIPWVARRPVRILRPTVIYSPRVLWR